MIGVFASLFAMHGLGIETGDPAKTGVALVVTVVIVMLVAMTVSGLTAVAMERVAYRPLRRRNAPRLSALITAIGMSLFLQELFAVRYGREILGFPRILEKRQLASFGGADIRTDKVLVLVSAVVLMVALERFVAKSRLGRGIRAAAQDAETAAMMGVDINRVVVLTFLLGGILAGAAGTLFGIFFEAARFDIGFLPGIKAFTAAVLGGIGNVSGAMLGGFVLGMVEVMAVQYIPHGSAWRDAWAFAVLILVLVFRPAGLLGERVASRS
jgi:branched-chain amino acid transport system permease protein